MTDAPERGPAPGDSGAGVDEPGRAVDARERMADERDRVADVRDHEADERDRLAEVRDEGADQREVAADAREDRLNALAEELRERAERLHVAVQSVSSHSTELLALAEHRLDLAHAAIERSRARIRAQLQLAARDQAEIDRETRASSNELRGRSADPRDSG